MNVNFNHLSVYLSQVKDSFISNWTVQQKKITLVALVIISSLAAIYYFSCCCFKARKGQVEKKEKNVEIKEVSNKQDVKLEVKQKETPQPKPAAQVQEEAPSQPELAAKAKEEETPQPKSDSQPELVVEAEEQKLAQQGKNFLNHVDEDLKNAKEIVLAAKQDVNIFEHVNENLKKDKEEALVQPEVEVKKEEPSQLEMKTEQEKVEDDSSKDALPEEHANQQKEQAPLGPVVKDTKLVENHQDSQEDVIETESPIPAPALIEHVDTPKEVQNEEVMNEKEPTFLPADMCKIVRSAGLFQEGKVEIKIADQTYTLGFVVGAGKALYTNVFGKDYQPISFLDGEGNEQVIHVQFADIQKICDQVGEDIAFAADASITDRLIQLEQYKQLELKGQESVKALDRKVKQLQDKFCLTEIQMGTLRRLLAIDYRKDSKFQDRLNSTALYTADKKGVLDLLEKSVETSPRLSSDSIGIIKADIEALKAEVRINLLFTNIQQSISHKLGAAVALEKTQVDGSSNKAITILEAFKFRANEYFAKQLMKDEESEENDKFADVSDQQMQEAITKDLELIREQITTAWESQVRNFEKKLPEPVYEQTHIPREFIPLAGFDWRVSGGYVFANNQSYTGMQTNYNSLLTECISNMRRKDINSITPHQIENATQEYKIHLMPKTEHMGYIIEKFQDKLRSHPTLKKHVHSYKVLEGKISADGSLETLILDGHGNPLPKFVIYTTSKDDAQKMVDILHELFKDDVDKGEGKTPRLNEKINDLIYYAQFSADAKYAMPDLFENGGTHFKSEIRLPHWPEGTVVKGNYDIRVNNG